MPRITTKDGTEIDYKDWGGSGQGIVFCHGWPLSADHWDAQLLFFGQRGYRVIAHDRPGHGRSSQPWNGHEMDTDADDLAVLFETLELNNAILVGYSTGGGEVVRYLSRHGSKRVRKAVLIAFSATDFTEDLKKIEIPVLVIHGTDDQIVPIGGAGRLSAKILKNATLKVYPGFPHGMATTNPDEINRDLLQFFLEGIRVGVGL